MDIEQIKSMFDQCLDIAEIFTRDAPGGSRFENTLAMHEKKVWLVIGAGLTSAEAQRFFPRQRAERAEIPVRCEKQSVVVRFLFVLRPVEATENQIRTSGVLAPFCPGGNAPFVSIRQGYVKVDNLPDNNEGVRSLRWDIDGRFQADDPLEYWLTEWKDRLGFNAAYAPSHLHINTPIFSPDEELERKESSPTLHLAIGNANPLAFFLSLAAWLRNPNSQKKRR